MMRLAVPRSIVAAVLLALAATPAAMGQVAPTDVPPPQSSPLDAREVRTTILPGSGPAPAARLRPVQDLPGGDISLNFPAVDIQAVTKSVLGDTLGLPFAVDPSIHTTVSVVTPHPIRRADVLGFFEQSITSSGLTLVLRAGSYTVLPSASARAESPTVGPDDTGFGNETLALKFVNAEQMRKLLDPLVPGAVSVTDPAHNLLVVSGTSTQRKALRDLVAEFDVDWLKGMSFALFVPQRTDARLIAPELEKLLNAPGSPTAGVVTLIAMNQLNGILAISNEAQNLEDVRRFIEILDREGEGSQKAMFVYHVQNGRAADLAKVLNSAFGVTPANSTSTGIESPDLIDHSSPAANTLPASMPSPLSVSSLQPKAPVGVDQAGQTQQRGGDNTEGTSITADETNNAIIVFATPRNYALIEDALRKLDVPPLQVMIDATISEVTLNHDLQYGIQWSAQWGHNSAALSQGTTNAPVQNFPGFSYLYQGANFQATFNALKTVTDVTVLSAPKLMVLNNHTATIEVGDQVPISTGSAQSTLTSGAPIVNSIEYRDTGVILKITPRVNSGGLVLLDIAQEVSDVLPISSAQKTSGIDSPTIEQRKISTSVAVQDGETVALGGLIKNQVTKGRSTLPLLGDIPLLGHLFGDTTSGVIRTELVVLLTPRVVRNPVDARAVTQELRDNIHLAAPPPALHRPAPHVP